MKIYRKCDIHRVITFYNLLVLPDVVDHVHSDPNGLAPDELVVRLEGKENHEPKDTITINRRVPYFRESRSGDLFVFLPLVTLCSDDVPSKIQDRRIQFDVLAPHCTIRRYLLQ